MTNRIEWLAGYRWAKEIVEQSANLLNLMGGSEKMLGLLERGMVQKPPSYAEGVREIVTMVQDFLHVRAMRAKT